MIYELTAKNDRQLCLCIRLLAAEKIPFTLTVHSEKKGILHSESKSNKATLRRSQRKISHNDKLTSSG